MKSSDDKPVTKKEFNKKFEKFYQKIVQEIKDPIMNKLDAFLKEIRDSPDEQTLLAWKESEHSDRIEEHETRLKTLEKTVLKN